MNGYSGGMAENPNDPGGDALDHWDPENPRDMGAIRRLHARYPKAFRDMNAEKQAKLVRIVDKAADVAEAMLDKEETKPQGAVLAESVARTGALLSTIRLKDEHHAADHNQRERHHADDVARGAGTTNVSVGVAVNLTDTDRVRIAVEAGVAHMLPPELAERARELEAS